MQARNHHSAEQVAHLAARGHRGAHREREPDHVPRVRHTLLLIRVQDGLRQPSVDHAGELPREVRRVAQARAHALADERRCQVRGVAEDEHVATAPAVRHLRAERVLGDAHELQLFWRNAFHPRPDQRVERRHGAVVVGRLVRQESELPPVAGIADPHVGGRSMRVADLVDALPLVQLRGRRHIDHQPTLLKLQVLHAGADRCADQAVGAVAAEQISRLHPVLLAADPIGERDLHSVGADLNGLGHLGIAPKNGVRVSASGSPAAVASNSGWSNMFACGNPLALSAHSR